MATIVTRSGKGSALTFTEADNNFTNLNNDKIELTSLSVGAEGTPAGNGSLSYNNTTGVFTYTPPTALGIGAIGSLSDDNTPSLGGPLDVGTNAIYTNATNASINITADGTGTINLNSNVSVSSFANYSENISVSATTTGTWAPDFADAPIQYVAMTGNMTINDFATPTAGASITIIFDGTGGSYTLTLGAKILKAGGSATLTTGGMDVLTITCVDDTPAAEVYLASLATNFS